VIGSREPVESGGLNLARMTAARFPHVSLDGAGSPYQVPKTHPKSPALKNSYRNARASGCDEGS
jgi:hypothetical protein